MSATATRVLSTVDAEAKPITWNMVRDARRTTPAKLRLGRQAIRDGHAVGGGTEVVCLKILAQPEA